MFPPSIHPNGEEVAWESQGDVPSVEWNKLRFHAGLAAFLAVCIRMWPATGTRDETSMALAGALLSAGLSADHADRAAKFVAEMAGDEEYEKRGKAASTAEKIARGEPVTGLPRLVDLLGLPDACVKTIRKWLLIKSEPLDLKPTPGNRKAIEYLSSELVRVVDESEQALIEARTEIYQMNGRLVRPVSVEGTSFGGVARTSGALVLRDVNPYWLLEAFMRAADYYKPMANKNGDVRPVPCQPPMPVAHHYLSREGGWKVPILRAVVETPTIRPDGTILQTDGYDPASGLLVNLRGVSFPPIPDEPTENDAREALAKLKDIISEFPFEERENGSPSRSVTLSAVLTAVSRRALRTAPMHAFTAPTMGTGKSLLADIVSIIATGRPAAIMSQGKSEEEDEKRYLSVLMQGDPIVVIDNIDRPIQGDAICSILTQETWQCRQLGTNRQAQVATNALFIATGNNLEFRKDMATRAIQCRLDAKVENPEARRFKRNLRSELPALRAELVVAALTVLRAFVVAGRPGAAELKQFGRYEEWSELIRGTLVWLGEPDPCDTRAEIMDRDMAREEQWALLKAWHERLGTSCCYTANQVIMSGEEGDDFFLKFAIENVCPRGVSARSLGRYLSKIDGRIVGGLRIKLIPDKKHGGSYRLEECDGFEPQQLDMSLW
jgi:hypothetical protein